MKKQTLFKLLFYCLIISLLLREAYTKIKFNLTKKTKTDFSNPWNFHVLKQTADPIPLVSWDLPLLNIEIGTPPQVFEVLLETASLESWVPLRRGSAQTLNFKKLFNQEISRTYKNLNERKVIFHRDGYINGTQGTENVAVQGTALSDFHMYFADQAVFIRDIQYNGILAMGNFNENSTYARKFSFLENLVQQKKIERRMFSIEYFKKDENNDDYNSTNKNYSNSSSDIKLKSDNKNIKNIIANEDENVKGILTIGSYPDSIKEYLSGLKSPKGSAKRPWGFLDDYTYEGSPTNMHNSLDIYRTYNNRNSHFKNASVYSECDIVNFNNILSPTSNFSTNNNPNNLWSCNLNYIYFPSTDSRVAKMRDLAHKTAIFDSGINGIYIPYSIFEKYFIKIYLKNLLENHSCKMSRYQINCKKDLEIANLPEIYLNFGNFTAKLNPSELFRDIRESGFEYKIFLVMVSMLDEDLFLIGTPFLNKFTTVFDWDRQKMGFFGADVSLDEPAKVSKLGVGDVLMVAGVCLLLLVFSLFGLLSGRRKVVENVSNREGMEPLNQQDFRGFNRMPNDPSEERKSSLENLS